MIEYNNTSQEILQIVTAPLFEWAAQFLKL